MATPVVTPDVFTWIKMSVSQLATRMDDVAGLAIEANTKAESAKTQIKMVWAIMLLIVGGLIAFVRVFIQELVIHYLRGA